MKRTGFGGILMLLLCLGLIAMEARGDDLQRFLAQLQSEAASEPETSLPAQPSEVTSSESICRGRANCPDGSSVECEGYEYCESRSDVCWAMCVGVYYSCDLCW
jgi:hypothetical protein